MDKKDIQSETCECSACGAATTCNTETCSSCGAKQPKDKSHDHHWHTHEDQEVTDIL